MNCTVLLLFAQKLYKLRLQNEIESRILFSNSFNMNLYLTMESG